MKLRVFHRTKYHYAAQVRQSLNEARLQPADDGRQRRRSFQLNIAPTASLYHQVDFYGNTVHFFEISPPHGELLVEAVSLVDTCDKPALEKEACPASLAALRGAGVSYELFDYLQPSQFVGRDADIVALAEQVAGTTTDAWQCAQTIMGYVHGSFHYQPSVTHVHTTMQEALRLRQGVCQDFAHVMIGLCRALGIPTRYVSGYIYNGPVGKLKGAQATHAWTEVWIPNTGWVGLDPTNDCPADGRYVKAAAGRDYADVAPIKGTYRGTADRSLTVDVLVTSEEEAGASSAQL